jgi:signal transduction histidine kinase
LLVGASLITALLHVVTVFLQMQPVVDALLHHIEAQVHSVRGALQATAPAQRAALARAMSNDTVHISLDVSLDDLGPLHLPMPPSASAAAGSGAAAAAIGIGVDDGPAPVAAMLVAQLRTSLRLPVFEEPRWLADDDPGGGAGGGGIGSGDLSGLRRAENSAEASASSGVLRTLSRPPRWTVLLPLDGQVWRLSFTGIDPWFAGPLLGLLGSLILVGTVALLAQWLGLRMVTRPLQRLAHDVMARRHDLRLIDEAQHPSEEMQGVVRAFNALVQTLRFSARTRRDLLAGVSHDLRTPLARLRLRIEIEGGDALAERTEADFAALAHIIDQFLAYAQGQDGVAIGQAVPLAALAEAMVAEYRSDGVDVSLLRCHDAGLCPHDVGMRRLLCNLIDNARAHGSGPIEVEIGPSAPAPTAQPERHERHGGPHGSTATASITTTTATATLSIMVYDRGKGIAPAHLARACEPFVRLNATQDGHCGLGLAIVAQVAHQLGGTVQIAAFDGQRSGVGVTLPLTHMLGR